MKTIITFIFFLATSSASAESVIEAKSKILLVDEHSLHVTTWGKLSDQNLPWVVMISGPIDSWHSDSAWFAHVAPILANNFRVMAIDRAGQVNGIEDAPVGYQHFAKDLHLVLSQYAIENATLIAFASSNVSAQIYFDQHKTQRAIDGVLLIDPDVLTPFSIDRYAADAKPFKDNLEQYLDYISQGKYTSRVEQKNTADMTVLKTLSTSETADWRHVEKIFASRLLVNNQISLFREIARYNEDLQAAAKVSWPAHIPTIIVDTQFETKYIENTEDQEAKDGLIAWQKDAKAYYKALANINTENIYREVSTQAHLFQVEQPQVVAELVVTLQSKSSK